MSGHCPERWALSYFDLPFLQPSPATSTPAPQDTRIRHIGTFSLTAAGCCRCAGLPWVCTSGCAHACARTTPSCTRWVPPHQNWVCRGAWQDPGWGPACSEVGGAAASL